MKVGIIGLGRMGGNIARRLMRGGHEVVVFDRSAESVKQLASEGAIAADGLYDMQRKLSSVSGGVFGVGRKAAQSIFWVMLPAGKPTEDTIAELADLGQPRDIIIDGGNTFYKDDIRRAKVLGQRGIDYVDVGTSGGVWGLERGYCMMIGGKTEAMQTLDPIFATLAPGMGDIPRTKERKASSDDRAERGYIHAGPAGAGHFVKMIHNGIEYGMMQAFAEGFDILKNKTSDRLPEDERFDLNLTDIAEVWRRGSVVSSWLLDLTAQALAGDEKLDKFSGQVADSGEGQWTIEAAMEEAVPAHVLTASLFARYRSRTGNTFGEKVLSAMRFGFGGHVEQK